MSVLVTGAAGFIGFHVARALLGRGERVIGLDNLNDYYSVTLKRDRLGELAGHNGFSGFSFEERDISDTALLEGDLARAGIRRIVHLAAQAGVRYSLEAPMSYVRSNLAGHVVMMELARSLDGLEHMVYASSSSVYGANRKLPFSVADRVDHPVSLYGATKRADELISQTYAGLHGIPQTGLRFFTVYGPWGRPDMALWKFTEAILANRPIHVFNHGDMARDFTYIDDIVAGVLAALDHPPKPGSDIAKGEDAPHIVYNIGNHKAEPLLRVIALLEEALGRKAEQILEPMQPGDIKETYADIDAIREALGFEPRISIDEGIPRFVDWYRAYHKV